MLSNITEKEEDMWTDFTDKVWDDLDNGKIKYTNIPSWWFDDHEEEYGDGTREGTIPSKEEFILNIRNKLNKRVFRQSRSRIVKNKINRQNYILKRFLYK